MYSLQDQLTELVRHLETNNYVFAADPILITEKLQAEPSPPLTKLHHRAGRIDADGKLAKSLASIDTRVKGVITALTLFWLVAGFAGIVAIMQAKELNFFYILVSLLGFHTLMLLLWLGWMIIAPRNTTGFLTTLIRPSAIVRTKDVVTQASVQLYEEQLQHAGMKWYISRISHQFWLASLIGMLAGLVMMLLIKDYTFIWESTLLQNTAVTKIVEILAYLPNLVGFPTPTAANIIEAQTHPQGTFPMTEFHWAMLLIGSLLIYGIVPRFLVWLFSLIMVKSRRFKLDIKQPYYQKILDYWQRGVIDPDDSPVETKPIAPTARVSQAKKLVALLEYPYPDEYWYQFAGGHNIDYFGILDDREDMEKMAEVLQKSLALTADNLSKNALQSAPIQVLLGIPPQALPDRGTMRKLDKIASLATGGLIVQLLPPSNTYLLPADEQAKFDERKAQWETALAERQIAVVRV